MAGSLPLLQGLSQADQHSFFTFGRGPVIAPRFQLVHDAFSDNARAFPEQLAVVDVDNTSITYKQLDEQSTSLAWHLRDIGVKRGDRVCLLVERSIPMLVGVLAVLKAGAAYVPLDGTIVTDSTLHHILRDANVSVVLHLHKFAHRVEGINGLTNISLDTCDYATRHGPVSTGVQPSDSVYIIYTSGTTGLAKGVDVLHRGLANLVGVSPGDLGVTRGTKVGQFMAVAFDMAQWEIWAAFANGGTLCLRGTRSKHWQAVMRSINVMVSTPSMLLRHNPVDYPNIRTVAVAGEPCPQATADAWATHTHFYNCCGPTEITIVNTMQLHRPGAPISIGKPIANTSVYVLGEDMRPVAMGEVGVMWAGGAGISRGYVSHASDRYVQDPFAGDGSVMFNTGDLGRWFEDGTLEPLGRIDDQVKIKGFRVELDGVSVAMGSHEGVTAAVALLVDGQLWGVVTPVIENSESIKDTVAKVQPKYAVPSRILCLDAFPATSNGKTDKRALKQLICETSDKTTSENSSLTLTTQSDSDSKSQFSSTNKTTGSDSVLNDLPALPFNAHSLVESGDKEKENWWDGYENEPVPDKTQGKRARNLRHLVFTLYRRLFGVVFVTNMAIFIATAVRGATAMYLGKIVVANLFCAILMRQDYVINAFFTVFTAVPNTWPMSIRRVCARVYHIGGLHSGCAVSGVVWLIFFAGQATREFATGGLVSAATITVTYILLLLLLGIVFLAYPPFRLKRHDNFESSHRYFGWTATALVWTQIVLLTNDYKEPGQSLAAALRTSAPFWLVVLLTVSIILPWVRLRKVDVRSEVLSTHAVRLHFDYVTPVPGSFTRIAEHPLKDWHGFATVPLPNQKGYSLVVSRAGDFTSRQIDNPPKKIWVRGIPTCGVLRIVPLFRRVVFVATGSGIGPCAPCILAKSAHISLLWTSPDVRKTFGDKLVDDLLEAAPGAVIWDTRKNGKPDMVKLTYKMVKDFDAEAVCIISNSKLTQKVVYGMTSRGIPAFGAIWDS
ncbi:nonribosomal peptide synthetase 12 [Cylindrobasidium torrendii FP15055 ss-10]|uniref:Nonribosomal peptide synthetase 12 n=1 Tax=Cylindrobasidium torrendii FP15055 ss-10 TaxID=1314674 RepID=A0A0D7BJ22_9AGAR|nr:nonribosomal peptide synthetase 12 [Cylindrobasidium torrendii FP15055 ss-10]